MDCRSALIEYHKAHAASESLNWAGAAAVASYAANLSTNYPATEFSTKHAAPEPS